MPHYDSVTFSTLKGGKGKASKYGKCLLALKNEL